MKSIFLLQIIITTFSLSHGSNNNFKCKTPSFHNVLITKFTQPQSERNLLLKDQQQTKNLTFSGCISPDHFSDTFAVECVNQPVFILQKNAVQNLNKLDSVVFKQNGMSLIVPGAFNNLSEIFKIEISSNNIVKLQRKTFDELRSVKEINLSENKISKIEKGAFSELSSLWDINLNKNKLKTFDATWFENCTRLARIHMSENLLTEIPDEAFITLPQISRIDFSKNQISVLHEKSFHGWYTGQRINLSNNKIKQLPSNLFKPFNGLDDKPLRKYEEWHRKEFNYLEDLVLDNNLLQYIPTQVKKDFGNRLKNLVIHSNPWKCSCYLNLISWTESNNIKLNNARGMGCYYKTDPVCVAANTSACIETIDPKIYEGIKFEYVEPDFWDKEQTCYN